MPENSNLQWTYFKGGLHNDVDNIRTGEKREYIQIQTAKMLLRQLKPFIKTWAQPGPGPNNFKSKTKAQ